MNRGQSIWYHLLNDGRALLGFSGLSLFFCGAFALFLTAAGQFLPHDAAEIGFTAEALSTIAPKLVLFMFHDRAAFGGVLLAIGVLYVWLAYFPLGQHIRWAWMTFLISGFIGFASFLLYIGYGYLDVWHLAATLAILPVFVLGLIRSYCSVSLLGEFRLLPRWRQVDPRNPKNSGDILLFGYAGGLIAAGATICFVGVTTIFVPQDLEFIGMCGGDISGISDRLLGVIAHDRAGFGGGVISTGVMTWLILTNAERTRHL